MPSKTWSATCEVRGRNRGDASMNLSLLRSGLGVPVLMFHGLCEQIPKYALWSGGRTCLLRLEDFSKLIEWCSKNYHILRLQDLEEYLTSGNRKRPAMILTFDDGLASVIDLAVPVLQEYRASAVVFVTTGWTDLARSPDIFALERIVWEHIPTNLVISVNGKRLELQVTSRAQIPEAFTKLWGFLFEVRFPPLKLVAEDVLVNSKPWERDDTHEDRHFWFPASWEELRAAAQTEVIEIGSHMVSHLPLPWLSDDEKRFQLQRSHDELSRIIGLPVIACSYPHGFADDSTITMAEKIYRWGFTNKPGRVGVSTPRGTAPRYHVPGESQVWIRWELRWGRSAKILRRVKSSFTPK